MIGTRINFGSSSNNNNHAQESRRHRSQTQPIFLMERDDEHKKYKVCGTTGNLYTVQNNDNNSFTCTCPDYQNRRRNCKHIYFITDRVLQYASNSELLGETLAPSNLQSLFRQIQPSSEIENIYLEQARNNDNYHHSTIQDTRSIPTYINIYNDQQNINNGILLQHIRVGVAIPQNGEDDEFEIEWMKNKERERKEKYEREERELEASKKWKPLDEGDNNICTICFDDMEKKDDLFTCEFGCGTHFHSNCVMMWFSQGKSTCPFCRYNIEKKKNKKRRIY